MQLLSTSLIPYYFAGGAEDKPSELEDVQVSLSPDLEPAPLPPQIKPDELPFPPVDPVRARQALATFYDARRGPRIGLDIETGLPAFLYGDLADRASGDLLEASAAFLMAQEPLVAGNMDETVAQPACIYRWSGGTTHIAWRQTNSAGVPVYGAAINLTYSGRHLAFIANTLHSARRAELDAFTWDESWPKYLEQVSWQQGPELTVKLGALPEELRPRTFEPPRDLRQESAERGWRADRWILPLVPRQPPVTEQDMMEILLTDAAALRLPGRGVYRPIWRTVGVDAQGRRWLLFVDAETYEVLAVEPTRIGDQVDAWVFRTPADATAAAPDLVTLDFGAGNPDIEHADYVTLAGARMADPEEAVVGEPEEMATRRLLTATAFYQARQAQTGFGSLLASLVLDAAITMPPPGVRDPTLGVVVSLDEAVATGAYDFVANTIHFGRGVPSSSAPVVPAVYEPGLDGDVLAHEFCHGITRFLNSLVFEYHNHNDVKELLTRQLDEGVAFYFGCSLSGGATWAEYAYADWGNLRNLAAGSVSAAAAPSDPHGTTYRLGMWWARVFWALHGAPGVQADKLILKALTSLAGPLTRPAVMFYALLDPLEQYGPLSSVRAVLQQTGIPF